MTGQRMKVQAVFLAAIMVLSMVAIPMSVAALQAPSEDPNDLDELGDQTIFGESGASIAANNATPGENSTHVLNLTTQTDLNHSHSDAPDLRVNISYEDDSFDVGGIAEADAELRVNGTEVDTVEVNVASDGQSLNVTNESNLDDSVDLSNPTDVSIVLKDDVTNADEDGVYNVSTQVFTSDDDFTDEEASDRIGLPLSLPGPVALYDEDGEATGESFTLISDAIDAAEEGYTVDIGEGEFRERGDTIVVDKNGLTLQGDGTLAIEGTNTLEIDAEGVTVDGLTFEGEDSENNAVANFDGSLENVSVTNNEFLNYSDATTVDLDLTGSLGDVTESFVNENYFSGDGTGAISVSGGADLNTTQIQQNDIYTDDGDGIVVSDFAEDTDLALDGNSVEGADTGLEFGDSVTTNVTISELSVNDTQTGIDYTSDADAEEFTLDGSDVVLTNIGGDAVSLDSADTDFEINNIVVDGAVTAINVADVSDSIDIDGVSVNDSTTGVNFGDSSASYLNITGSSFTEIDGDAVDITKGPETVTVQSTVFEDVTGTAVNVNSAGVENLNVNTDVSIDGAATGVHVTDIAAEGSIDIDEIAINGTTTGVNVEAGGEFVGLTDSEITESGTAVAIDDDGFDGSLFINRSDFDGNDAGINLVEVADAAEIEIRRNNFVNTENDALAVADDAVTTETVDVTRNWWNDSTGANVNDGNQKFGLGDDVHIGTGSNFEDNSVRLAPWLDAPRDDDPTLVNAFAGSVDTFEDPAFEGELEVRLNESDDVVGTFNTADTDGQYVILVEGIFEEDDVVVDAPEDDSQIASDEQSIEVESSDQDVYSFDFKLNTGNGSFSGIVRDNVENRLDNDDLDNVTFTLSQDGEIVQFIDDDGFTADSGDGSYETEDNKVVQGTYDIEANHPDFDPTTIEDVEISPDEVTENLNFTLASQTTGTLSGDIEVDGDDPGGELEGAEITITADGVDVDDLDRTSSIGDDASYAVSQIPQGEYENIEGTITGLEDGTFSFEGDVRTGFTIAAGSTTTRNADFGAPDVGLNFSEQNTDGSNVLVDNVTLSSDDFIVGIENESGDIIGTSDAYDAGEAPEDFLIELEDYDATEELTAQIHGVDDDGSATEEPISIFANEHYDPVDENADVTLSNTSVAFDDQTFDDETDEVNVSSTVLFEDTGDGEVDDAPDYSVQIHEVDDDGEVGDIIGNSTVLNGEEEDVTVELDREITDPEDLVAMLHIGDEPADDPAYQIVTADGQNTVTDSATITIDVERLTFEDQALSTDEDGNALVAATDVFMNENSTFVVTNDNDEIVGLYESDEALEGETVSVVVDSEPGEHTAHVVSNVSNESADDGVISNDTADNVTTQETAVVYDVSLTFEDQQFDEALEAGDRDVRVASVRLDGGNNGVDDFTVDLHPTDAEGDIIGDEAVGQTRNLPTDVGLNDVGITLTEDINETDDFVAMVHLGESSEPLSTDALVQFDSESEEFTPVVDSGTVTIGEEEQDDAFFNVSDLDAPANATQGDEIEVTANVTNTGDLEATQDVTFQFGANESELDVLLTEENVTLEGGETEAVTFTVDTSDVDAGEYVHGVFTDDDSETAAITIEEADEDDPEEVVVVGDSPATDTTGDGLLNDIDGDGEFTIFDVQAFFENRDSDAVQENVELFDFAQDGNVDIFDVQALFGQLQEE